MCWSGEASAAIAIGGLTSAYLLKRSGEPKSIYLPAVYFVIMEGLQAVTYIVAGKCGLPANTFLTYLAMVHISFQPVFINMLAMEFINSHVKNKIKRYVYFLSVLAALSCLTRLLPMWDTFGHCRSGTPICSLQWTCAYRGNWHIAWHVLLNGFNESWRWYYAAAFILPAIYGSWKMSLFHFLIGPFLASLTTIDPSEVPAIWCLFSTCIIALMFNTKLRYRLHVTGWPLWKYMH